MIVGLAVFFDRFANGCVVTLRFQEMRMDDWPPVAMIVLVMRMEERIGNERHEHRAHPKTRTEPSHSGNSLYVLPGSQRLLKHPSQSLQLDRG